MADKPQADVILSWFSSGSVAASAFQRPTKFVQLPTPNGQQYDKMLADIAQSMGMSNQPLNAVLKKYASDVRPARVALLGFSEGCQGVRSMLRSVDGRRADAVIAIDGIHAEYKDGSKTSLIPEYLTAWGAYAQLAVDGSRLMIDTTSAIVPPYPRVSTTDTSNWIWRYATGSDTPEYEHMPPDNVVPQYFDPPILLKGGSAKGLVWPDVLYELAPIWRYMNKGSFWVFNYENLDPTGHNDHVLQAEQILPTMLEKFLAPRWNTIAPADGICVVSGPEPSELGAAGCFHSTMLSDLYLSGKDDPAPLDIDPNADATIPSVEEPGHETPTGDTTSTDWWSSPSSAAKWAAGILGSALLLETARRTGKYLGERRKERAAARRSEGG